MTSSEPDLEAWSDPRWGPPAEREPALEVVHLSKAFGGTQALSDVSLKIMRNEIVGLVGENGAGKSTLLKILSGNEVADSGALRRDGKTFKIRSVTEATGQGVSMLSQEGSLIPNLPVAENIYLGHESRFERLGVINFKRMRAAAVAQLRKVGSEVDPQLQTWRVPLAQRVMIELARVMALQSDESRRPVIILDEPTSALALDDVRRLFEIMKNLRRYASLVFVSHHLNEVLEVCDRIYVLRDGRVVAERQGQSTDLEEVQRLMVGRDLDHEYYQERFQRESRPEIVLSVDSLTSSGAYADVSFELRAGEVLALCGVQGSGCEEILRSIAGHRRPSGGSVFFKGRRWACDSPLRASQLGIGYVPSERQREGVIPPLSVATNLTLPSIRQFSVAGLLLKMAAERSTTKHWIDALRIKTPTPQTPVGSLSGGNQQKVVLAKWLAAGVELLILDHPTRGVDVGAKEEVYQLVRQLTSQGKAMLLVADTLDEAIGLSHRVICMRDGRVTATFSAPAGGKPTQLELISAIT